MKTMKKNNSYAKRKERRTGESEAVTEER